ncbi:hypothetical protein PCE1_003799 [Barthelona sp. PCE]
MFLVRNRLTLHSTPIGFAEGFFLAHKGVQIAILYPDRIEYCEYDLSLDQHRTVLETVYIEAIISSFCVLNMKNAHSVIVVGCDAGNSVILQYNSRMGRVVNIYNVDFGRTGLRSDVPAVFSVSDGESVAITFASFHRCIAYTQRFNKVNTTPIVTQYPNQSMCFISACFLGKTATESMFLCVFSEDEAIYARLLVYSTLTSFISFSPCVIPLRGPCRVFPTGFFSHSKLTCLICCEKEVQFLSIEKSSMLTNDAHFSMHPLCNERCFRAHRFPHINTVVIHAESGNVYLVGCDNNDGLVLNAALWTNVPTGPMYITTKSDLILFSNGRRIYASIESLETRQHAELLANLDVYDDTQLISSVTALGSSKGQGELIFSMGSKGSTASLSHSLPLEALEHSHPLSLMHHRATYCVNSTLFMVRSQQPFLTSIRIGEDITLETYDLGLRHGNGVVHVHAISPEDIVFTLECGIIKRGVKQEVFMLSEKSRQQYVAASGNSQVLYGILNDGTIRAFMLSHFSLHSHFDIGLHRSARPTHITTTDDPKFTRFCVAVTAEEVFLLECTIDLALKASIKHNGSVVSVIMIGARVYISFADGDLLTFTIRPYGAPIQNLIRYSVCNGPLTLEKRSIRGVQCVIMRYKQHGKARVFVTLNHKQYVLPKSFLDIFEVSVSDNVYIGIKREKFEFYYLKDGSVSHTDVYEAGGLVRSLTKSPSGLVAVTRDALHFIKKGTHTPFPGVTAAVTVEDHILCATTTGLCLMKSGEVVWTTKDDAVAKLSHLTVVDGVVVGVRGKDLLSIFIEGDSARVANTHSFDYPVTCIDRSGPLLFIGLAQLLCFVLSVNPVSGTFLLLAETVEFGHAYRIRCIDSSNFVIADRFGTLLFYRVPTVSLASAPEETTVNEAVITKLVLEASVSIGCMVSDLIVLAGHVYYSSYTGEIGCLSPITSERLASVMKALHSVMFANNDLVSRTEHSRFGMCGPYLNCICSRVLQRIYRLTKSEEKNVLEAVKNQIGRIHEDIHPDSIDELCRMVEVVSTVKIM